MILEPWLKALQEQTDDKPTALGTPLRYSDAGSCALQIGYKLQGVTPSNPTTVATTYNMGVGTLLHETIQAAFPNAILEAKSELEGFTISGSADIFIPDDGGTVVEIKTVGSFAFDKAIGLTRKGRKLKTAAGPRCSALLQAGMNAIGLGAKRSVVVYVSREVVSKQLGEQVGLEGPQRFMAEWELLAPNPTSFFEAQRQKLILETLKMGQLPKPIAIDDNYKFVELTPFKGAWQCEYCRFRDHCRETIAKEST